MLSCDCSYFTTTFAASVYHAPPGATDGSIPISITSVSSNANTIFSFSRTFRKEPGVPPSTYIGAMELPIKYEMPINVAGYILRRAEKNAEPGLALWNGYDFSRCNPADFQTASPEGGAVVAVWTEIDGEKCYLFGVCCKHDATIPDGMVRCVLPAGHYAMFLVPKAESAHELGEKIRAALAPAMAHCKHAKTIEPIPDAPVIEYFNGSNTFLSVPIRSRRS